MVDTLLSLIFPAIICALPFITLFILVNLRAIKNSAFRTGIAVIGLTILNAVTSVLAMSLSIYGMTRNLPKDEPKCVTGAVTFIMLSVLFALLTLAFGTVYTYRNYLLQKMSQDRDLENQN